MSRCISVTPLGSDFDGFLFAPIGEDKNGMLLSVASALARLDIDPWQEAEALARLPLEAAIQRLARLIAPLLDGLSTQGDAGTTIKRLIGLLPRPTNSSPLPRPTNSSPRPGPGLARDAAPKKSRMILYGSIILVALMLTLIARVFIGDLAPRTAGDDTHLSTTVAPDTPNAGR